MEISLEEFFETHRPVCKADLFDRNKMLTKTIEICFRKRRSFVLTSERAGTGKHTVLKVLSPVEVELVNVNEDWTSEDVKHRDRSRMNLETFMDRRENGREVVDIVEENVVTSKQCQPVITTLIGSTHMCVYLFTTGKTQNMNPSLKQLLKNVGGCHVVLPNVPKIRLNDYFCRIGHMYDTKVSKRASNVLVHRVYGNIRVLLRLMYIVLDRCKRQCNVCVTTPLVMRVVKTSYMDGFSRFIDVYDRCKDKEAFSYEERMDMCMTSSYAYHKYCYNSVSDRCQHPFTNVPLELEDSVRMLDLFSFIDTLSQEYSCALLLSID